VRATELMTRIAETDSTFSFDGERWRGKCLICNGWLSFDPRTGFGANVEHIRPRSLGGDSALTNLGLTHPGCNGEKGRNWDPRRRHRADPERYRAIVEGLLRKRRERWRGEGLRAED
jgi:5-methylcytosine-specific restriction endonuclease McrA